MSVAGPTRLRWMLPVVLLGLVVAAVQAASPVFWRVSTQAEFLEGEVESLSIDTTGQLRLGPLLAHSATLPPGLEALLTPVGPVAPAG